MSLGSRIPNPTNCSGLCTRLQATKHLPPCTIAVPVHKNTFMIFFSVVCIHVGRLRLMKVYIGTAERVVLISVRCSLQFINRPFQTRSLLATLCTIGCSADFRTFFTNRGIPRYFNRKSATRQEKMEIARWICSSLHRIKANWHL
jgi:hypothetical protein